MIQATCIQKVRDKNGKIISYALQDQNGQQQIFEPHKLKYAIIYNEIAVDNLKMTSDGRLIDCTKADKSTDRIIKVDISGKMQSNNLNVLQELLVKVGINSFVNNNCTINGIKLPTIRIKVDENKRLETPSKLDRVAADLDDSGKLTFQQFGVLSAFNGIYSDDPKKVNRAKRVMSGGSVETAISPYIQDGTTYIDLSMYTELLKDTLTGNIMIDTSVFLRLKDINENVIENSDYLNSVELYINSRLDGYENKITMESEKELSQHAIREWIDLKLNNIQEIIAMSFLQCLPKGNIAGNIANSMIDKDYEKKSTMDTNESIDELRKHTVRGSAPIGVSRPNQAEGKGLTGIFNKFQNRK